MGTASVLVLAWRSPGVAMTKRGVADWIARVLLSGVAGGLIGWIAANLWDPVPPESPQLVPAPYRISKYSGGTALRLAMVHDVLHERYLHMERHGTRRATPGRRR